MKFIKGMIVGGMITAGIAMVTYTMDKPVGSKKKVMKMGKQFARKMGLI